jgi:glycerol-3-phosphate dehydrogenase (NAD(P)+)
MRPPARIGVLGAGSWGTALTVLLQSNGHNVTLWEFDSRRAKWLIRTRRNRKFLPGVIIPRNVAITSSLEEAVSGKELILITLPSHVIRQAMTRASSMIPADALLVSGSKGIENDTLMRVSQVLVDTVPSLSLDRYIVLSGPSHAEEVGRGIPTAVVAASVKPAAARRVQEVFMNPAFRIYTSVDVVGVELGGSLKNIIAIAAGILDGVGYGDNAKAALLTRGIVEITRLGVALEANGLTFSGLSGMGDLIVTCTSRHSRNRYVGEQIGLGKTLEEVMEEMVMVAEGVRTTRSARDLAQKHNVDMPITREVYQVLFEKKPPKQAVFDLMTRDPKSED